MIDQLLARENYQIAKQLLDAAAMRHEALAANIANIETPGFKRLDIAPDFGRQMAQLASEPGSIPASDLKAKIAEDHLSRSVRPDGNNVELDRELIELNRNTLEYDFLAQYASDSIKRLKTAISGRIQ